MHFIDKILASLKSRLDYKGCLMLYVEKGEALQTISFFQPPLTEPELAEWEQQLGFSLPSNYRLLLKFTNGMKIFQLLMDNVNIGGGSLALAKYNSIEQM